VLAGEGDQFGEAEHTAVLARDLDDRAGRAQARETGEVHGGLGVAVTDPARRRTGAGAEDVAGADEVVGLGAALART